MMGWLALYATASAASGGGEVLDLTCAGEQVSFVSSRASGQRAHWIADVQLNLGRSVFCTDECRTTGPLEQSGDNIRFSIPSALFSIRTASEIDHPSRFDFTYNRENNALRGYWSSTVGTNLQIHVDAVCAVRENRGGAS